MKIITILSNNYKQDDIDKIFEDEASARTLYQTFSKSTNDPTNYSTLADAFLNNNPTIQLNEEKNRRYYAAILYALAASKGDAESNIKLTKLYLDELKLEKENQHKEIIEFPYLELLTAPNLVLAQRLDIAYLLYQSNINNNTPERQTLINFIKAVLDVDTEKSFKKKMHDRTAKRNIDPEYIPGQIKKLIPGLPDAHTAKNKAQFHLRKLAELALAYKRNKTLIVNLHSRQTDIDRDTKFLTPAERDAQRIIINDGQFKVMSNRSQQYTNFSTKDFKSHKKKGFAAYVINQNGEISVFNHHNMADNIAHSSMNEGKPVIAAGEIEIADGELKSLTQHSGHYRPDERDIYRVLKHFKKRGVDISKTMLHFFDPIPGTNLRKFDSPKECQKQGLEATYSANEFYREMKSKEKNEVLDKEIDLIKAKLAMPMYLLVDPLLDQKMSDMVKQVEALKSIDKKLKKKALAQIKTDIAQSILPLYADYALKLIEALKTKASANGIKSDDIDKRLRLLEIKFQLITHQKSNNYTNLYIILEPLNTQLSNLHDSIHSLESAILNGELDIVNAFIKNGQDAKFVDPEDNTYFHTLVNIQANQKNIPALIKTLAAAGANMDFTNSDGLSPISVAIMRRSLPLVKALVEAGARINMSGKLNNPLFLAVQHNNIQFVKLLLMYNADPVAEYTTPSAVELAANAKNPEILKAIINYPYKDPSVLTRVENELTRLFKMAVKAEDVDMLNRLISSGLQPRVFMMHYIEKGDLKAFNFVFQSIPKNNQKVESTYLLKMAADAGQVRILNQLIENGADVTELNKNLNSIPKTPHFDEVINILKAAQHNTTPLIMAVQTRKADLVEIELNIRKVDPNTREPGSQNNTALHKAAYLNDLVIVEKLLKAGADITPNAFGEKPQDVATDIDVINTLKCHENGKSYLCEIIVSEDPNMLLMLTQALQKGADPNRKERDDFLPLDLAITDGSIEAINLLLNAGADVSLKDPKNTLAFMKLAYERGDSGIIDLLNQKLFEKPSATRTSRLGMFAHPKKDDDITPAVEIHKHSSNKRAP